VTFHHRVEIPADSPFFTGHFPGHPVLPGIAHPLLVARALAATAGGAVRIAEIPFLKLRSPVLPGDGLEISGTGPGDDGMVRFDLRRGAEAVSQGTFRIAPAEWDGAAPLPVAVLETEPRAYPTVATLVPHLPPARLITEIVDASADGLTALAAIPIASPFVEDGRAPAFLGLEAAAQGAAALEALSRRDAAGPRIGYLVGLRDACFQTAWLPADRQFRIAVRLAGGAAALSIYEVTVEGEGGNELVRGTISTYITAFPGPATPS